MQSKMEKSSQCPCGENGVRTDSLQEGKPGSEGHKSLVLWDLLLSLQATHCCAGTPGPMVILVGHPQKQSPFNCQPLAALQLLPKFCQVEPTDPQELPGSTLETATLARGNGVVSHQYL